MAGLTVLIPTLNEASNLPLLMADLRRWPHPLQLLVVDAGSLPAGYEISARTPEGVLMGIRHRELPMEGVQFHPESILTRQGKPLLSNFLDGIRARGRR